MKNNKNSASTSLKGLVSQLENLLDEYLVKKSPITLPDKVKEFIVKAAPYLAIIGVVISIPTIVALVGLTSLLAPATYIGGVAIGRPYYGFGYIASTIIFAIVMVLEVIAIPGLFSRKRSAWNILFYSTLINLLGDLLSVNIGSLIIGGIISLYFLFQLRSYYK